MRPQCRARELNARARRLGALRLRLHSRTTTDEILSPPRSSRWRQYTVAATTQRPLLYVLPTPRAKVLAHWNRSDSSYHSPHIITKQGCDRCSARTGLPRASRPLPPAARLSRPRRAMVALKATSAPQTTAPLVYRRHRPRAQDTSLLRTRSYRRSRLWGLRHRNVCSRSPRASIPSLCLFRAATSSSCL